MSDFEKCFKESDTDGSGSLGFEEFRVFLIQMGLVFTDEKAFFLFRGSNLDRNPKLSMDEVRKLVDALQDENKIEVNKIYFRAIDRDYNSLLNIYEFPMLLRCNDIMIPKNELRFKFSKLTNNGKFASFDQCMKFILNVDTKEKPYPDDFVVPREMKKLIKIFDSIDTDHNEALDYDQFKEFIYTYIEDINLTELQVEAWFHGMDIENTKKIKKIEIIDLVQMLAKRPKLTLTYLYFRGCDSNRDGKLSLIDYRNFLLLNEYVPTPEEKAWLKSGKNETVDFTTAYTKIMGAPPVDTDPYQHMKCHKGTYSKFNTLWSSLDTTKCGHLTFDEFKVFLLSMVDDSMSEEQMELWFHGSDTNNNNTIERGELWHLTKAIWMNDLLELNRIYFKGIDVDNSGKISVPEIVTLYEINGIDLTQEEALSKIQAEAPGQNELTFAQFVHLTTNQVIDPNTDVYIDRKRKNGFHSRFEKLWKEFDKDESKGIDFDEFKGFMLAVSGYLMTEEQCFLYFDGIDVENKGYVSKKQCRRLHKAIQTNNKLELTKILFRGVDFDHSNKIELKEFMQLARINGSPYIYEDAVKIIRDLSKGGTSLTFPQFYNYIENKSIPADTQAYEPKQQKFIQNDQIFEELWTKIDTDAVGCIDFDGFKSFLIAYGHHDERETVFESMFRGTDINHNRYISKGEMRSLIHAYEKQDKKFMCKLFYRSVDLNNDGLIDIKEYCAFHAVMGEKVKLEAALQDFQKIGAKDFINYPQAMKLLYNIDIPEAESDPYDGLLDVRHTEFNQLFNEFDKDKSGFLEYDEFKVFLVAFVNPNMSELQCECFFRGADTENDGVVSQKELHRLTKALQKNDLLFLNKLYFRGLNKKESDRIDFSEFRTLAGLNNIDMSKEFAIEKILELSNGGTTLTFLQAMNYLTGMNISVNIDPYDGKLRKGGYSSRYDKVWSELVPKTSYMDKDCFILAVLSLADSRMTDEQCDIWFRGLDVNADNEISKDEFYILYTALLEGDTQMINEITYKGIENDKLTKEEKLALFYRVNNYVKTKQEIIAEAAKVPDTLLFPDIYTHVTSNKFEAPKYNPKSGAFCSCTCCCGGKPTDVEAPLISDEEHYQNYMKSTSILRWMEICASCLGFISLLLIFIATALSYNHFHFSTAKLNRKVKPAEFGSLEYFYSNANLIEKYYSIGIMFMSLSSCIVELITCIILILNKEGTVLYRFFGGPLIRGISYVFIAVASIGFNLKFSLTASILTLIAGGILIIAGLWKTFVKPKRVF